MPKQIHVLNGPNLNLLGVREPEVYGTMTLDDVDGALRALADELGVEVDTFQSNSEGALLDYLSGIRDRVDGVVINPAGFGHTSVALLDGLLALAKPFVEVHLSNPAARESFRHHSFLTGSAVGVVAGFGLDSYLSGFRCLSNYLERHGDGRA